MWHESETAREVAGSSMSYNGMRYPDGSREIRYCIKDEKP